jgi:hypothetical protein
MEHALSLLGMQDTLASRILQDQRWCTTSLQQPLSTLAAVPVHCPLNHKVRSAPITTASLQ